MARNETLEKPAVPAVSGTRDAVETAIEIAKKNLQGRWDGKLTGDQRKFNKWPMGLGGSGANPKTEKGSARGC